MKKLNFDGSLGSFLSLEIVNVLILIITLGFGMPWVLVRRFRWRAKHTLLDGRHFDFTGEALDLFGHWVLWWLLTLITFGLYSFILKLKVTEWEVNHTVYIDQFGGSFDGQTNY
ncbi:DUF898 domain-containing protein [Erysipelothrix urinaevulpis]|uniref:DUF898 family protein n=1 Tax=Erysipelothrix urinaevulpis TaxID=2683717 RepID=UPI00135BFD81|nr:DUF898 family protein [Erysipelothrix urinaevulpis]